MRNFIFILCCFFSLQMFSQREKDSNLYVKYFSSSLDKRLDLIKSKTTFGGKVDDVILIDISTLSKFQLNLAKDSIFQLFELEDMLVLKNKKKYQKLIQRIGDSLKCSRPLNCKSFINKKQSKKTSLDNNLYNYVTNCPIERLNYLDSLVKNDSNNRFLIKLIKKDIDNLLCVNTKELELNNKNYEAIREIWYSKLKKN